MYILIKDFLDDQLRLIHVNEIGYDITTSHMWITSHNNISYSAIAISQKSYEKIIKKLFEVGKLDLSNTKLRAYYIDDLEDTEDEIKE